MCLSVCVCVCVCVSVCLSVLHLFEVVGGDVAAGLGCLLLKAAQASLQRPHEALPQIVH